MLFANSSSAALRRDFNFSWSWLTCSCNARIFFTQGVSSTAAVVTIVDAMDAYLRSAVRSAVRRWKGGEGGEVEGGRG
jgi:hypothetical protein